MNNDVILWNKGPGCLSLVKRDKLEEITSIEDFWVHEMQLCKPISLVANRNASKILGISELKKFSYVLHYYQRERHNFTQFTKKLKIFFPRFYCINSTEINSEGNLLYLAGLEKTRENTPGKIILAVCEFKETLDIVTWMKISSDDSYGIPTVLKRVKGSEVLLIGCNGHIIVLEFLEKNRKIVKIGEMNDIHDNQISDLAFNKKVIYSKAINEDKVKIIELDVPDFDKIHSFKQDLRSGEVHRIRYNLKKTERISVNKSTKLEKIAITENGKTIYTGGGGLSILKYRDKKYNEFYSNLEKSNEIFNLKKNRI